jgi:hypothetical protein
MAADSDASAHGEEFHGARDAIVSQSPAAAPRTAWLCSGPSLNFQVQMESLLNKRRYPSAYRCWRGNIDHASPVLNMQEKVLEHEAQAV